MRKVTRYLFVATAVIMFVSGCATRQPAEESRAEPAEPTIHTLDLGDPQLKNEHLQVQPGDTYDASSGQAISRKEMMDMIADADVVYLGESHTSMNVHHFQAEVIDALAERGRSAIIGMEFFWRDNAKVLAEYIAGSLSEMELIREGGWYDRGGYNWGYYAPIMQAARQHGFPVVGINIDRMVIRAISRGGLESLDEEQRAMVGDVDLTNKEHRELIMFYFGGAAMAHGGSDEEAANQRLNRMYAAQSAWDQVFADSTLAALEEYDGVFVTIVGSGHVAYNLGTNRRLEEISDLNTITVYPVMVEEGETVKVSRATGDIIVGFADDTDPPFYPQFGISARDHGGAIVTGMLFPGSAALEAGLQQNDVILALDGVEMNKEVDLRIALAEKDWGEPAVLSIRRDGEFLEITITPERDSGEQ